MELKNKDENNNAQHNKEYNNNNNNNNNNGNKSSHKNVASTQSEFTNSMNDARKLVPDKKFCFLLIVKI